MHRPGDGALSAARVRERSVPDGTPLEDEAAADREVHAALLAVGGGDFERHRVVLVAPVQGRGNAVLLHHVDVGESIVSYRLNSAVGGDELAAAEHEGRDGEKADLLGHGLPPGNESGLTREHSSQSALQTDYCMNQ